MGRFELTCGVQRTALRVVIYGPEGIGKSTLAAEFPDPVFIDVEGGTNQLPVARLPRPTSWAMLGQEVEAVLAGDVPCSTVVLDTADAAEALCTRDVLATAGKAGIEDFGYGRGYTYLAEAFGKLLDRLSDVVEAGANVVVVSHAQMRKFERPDESGAYDRFELRLSRKVAPMVKEWADMVLFCDYKTYVTVDENGKAKASGGKRVIRTTHAPQWDAKNRFGLKDELPLEYESIASVVPDLRSAAPAEGPAPATHAAVGVPPASEGMQEVDRRIASMEADVAKVAKEPAPSPRAAPGDPSDAYPARLRPLVDLMRKDKVTDAELRRVVGQSGNFPESCAVTDYEQGFVDFLVSQWPTMLKRVETNRARDFEKTVEVPF
jgi:hypothetical protein